MSFYPLTWEMSHFLFPYIMRATRPALQTAGWVALLTQQNFFNSSAEISQSRMI